MRLHKAFQRVLITILAAGLLAPPAGFSQTAQSKPVQTTSTQSQATGQKAAAEWPREFNLPTGKLVVYQPQIDDWKDYKLVKARSAIAFLAKGTDNPKLGIIEMQAKTEVDFESRLVKLTYLQITGGNFPGLSKEDNEKALAKLQSMVQPDKIRSISLDRMLVSLERAGVKNIDLKNDPPKIFYSKKPAVLVIYDGKPVLSPIKESDLKFVVNTNWDVFSLESSKTVYLRNEKSWMQVADLDGPFTPAEKLPDNFKKLPKDDNFKDVLLNIPGEKMKAEDVPVVIVSEEPAELILLKGEPNYQPIPQTVPYLGVQHGKRSDLQSCRKFYYYLVSGRWFKTKNLDKGPWVFATPSLPEDFKKIPAEHAIGNLRASIPGTREAEEAIIQASIPQTAKVNKKTIKAPEVTYAGRQTGIQTHRNHHASTRCEYSR